MLSWFEYVDGGFAILAGALAVGERLAFILSEFDADNSEGDTITDLMNADLAEHTVSEIREAQARVELTEDERQTLSDRERDGKDRKSAVDVLEP